MESSKVSFKLFIENPSSIKEITDIVPVFHSWIQMHSISDHLLIDVADYAHVHNGPGIVLVSHEANYSLDKRSGKLGLTYQRKQPIAGSFVDRIRAALRSTIEAATLIELAPAFAERVTFRSDEIEFRICDRLHAPNTPETLAAIKPDLEKLFPGAGIDSIGSPQEMLTLIIRPATKESLSRLLDRTGATALA